eukprot:TRINITY_DN3995_c0_g1_i2.p1 TRINITY_DN3995_c0_g1~~TRINITY_DN3995_c0_g1_i2.p1  ORF type:complete len:337 (+),score=41.20 TRINITY_DN3995_c0_g1_i2:471-1481(+)
MTLRPLACPHSRRTFCDFLSSLRLTFFSYLIIRRLHPTQQAHLAVTSVSMAIVVSSGQHKGVIPPRVPQSLAHIVFTGQRGRAMLTALSSVLITVVHARTGQLLSVASGSIVRGSNSACYVLTSEHNLRSRKGTFDAITNPADTHILVAVNDSVSRAPKHRFRAVSHPACVDKELDLCVLHLVEVVSTVPERGVLERSPDSGNKRLVKALAVSVESGIGPMYGVLHAAQIGGVNTVSLGATLCVFGFPISGEESITMSEATASGFITGDTSASCWIKLHGNLDNGFSGGAVVLEATGELVGIVSHSRGHVDFARPAALALRLLERAVQVHSDLCQY